MGVQNVNKSIVEGLGCDACDRSFGSPKGLKLHISKKHGKENGDTSTNNEGLKKFQCEKCENNFTTQQSKDLHVKNYHENVAEVDTKVEAKELKPKIEPKIEELTEIKKESTPPPENSKSGTQNGDKSINDNQPKLSGKKAKIDNDPAPPPSSYKTKISFKCKYCHSIFGNSDDMIKHHLSNHMSEARL